MTIRLMPSLRWCMRQLDRTRRVLVNLLLLALLIGALWAWWRSGPPKLEDNTALVLNLSGNIVEQYSGSTRDNAVMLARGKQSPQTRLRDVLAVLDAAAKDDKITRLVLQLDGLGSAGLPMLREVAAAVERFKASGKPVLAWGTGYEQGAYYIAAQANEIYLHPMGSATLEGFGRYRNYYKDVLDRVGINAHVLRAGKFKNAAEPYLTNEPSPATIEADSGLYDALWRSYTGAVEKARKQPTGSIQQGIDKLPELFAAAGGNAAKLALDLHMVDGLKTHDEMRALLIERGVLDKASKSYRQVSFGAYLWRLKPSGSGDGVGVIVAEGGIRDGQAPPGQVGGDSTAALVRQAREDEHIKAVVLRVRSPGGSAFASELIRRELELTRKAGKPVVVSMGDLAASGGYWISMAADEVIADETTITGSIGVFAMLPSAERALDKVGLHTGGYATTWLAGAYDPRRGLDPRLAQVIQGSVDHIYADFTGLAAAARKTTREKIDAVAQGRVWTGAQARERGLVDTLGSYGDALKAAARLAKLPEGYRVQYMERERGRLERLLALVGGVQLWIDNEPASLAALLLDAAPPKALREAQQDLAWFAATAAAAKPFNALVHCLCGLEP